MAGVVHFFVISRKKRSMNIGHGQTILEEGLEERHTLRSGGFGDTLNSHESRIYNIKHTGITDETVVLPGSDQGG